MSYDGDMEGDKQRESEKAVVEAVIEAAIEWQSRSFKTQKTKLHKWQPGEIKLDATVDRYLASRKKVADTEPAEEEEKEDLSWLHDSPFVNGVMEIKLSVQGKNEEELAEHFSRVVAIIGKLTGERKKHEGWEYWSFPGSVVKILPRDIKGGGE